MWKHGFNSIIVSAGTGINLLLGLLFYLIVARSLTPSDFGIVAVVLSISVVISDIFDLGINTAIVKELAIGKRYLNTLFTIKLATALAVVLLGSMLSPIISHFLFKGAHAILIYLGFLGAGATILFGFWNYCLIANKKFIQASLLGISSNVFRLLIIFSLSAVSKQTALVAYVVSLFLVLPVGAYATRHLAAPRIEFDRTHLLSIFRFSRWIGASVALGSIFSRLDNFLIVSLSSSFQAGIYTSVQRIFLTVNQLPSAIGTALGPDLSSGNKNKVKKATQFNWLISIFLSLALVALILLTDSLVPLALGPACSSAIIPAKILGLGTIFFVLSMPANSYLIYTLGWSKVTFWITLVQLLMILTLNMIFVPQLQATGSALSYLISTFFGLSAYLLIFIKSYGNDQAIVKN